ncbi:MAG: OmpA family protein [Thermonemataceae bacterium]|nr:OmpA family protein [Thermonemataceae bacterium]
MKFYLIFLIISLSLACLDAIGQIDKVKSQGVVKLKDPIVAKNKESVFNFKNINHIKFYYNEKQFKKIDKLIKNRDFQNAYPLLFDYVMQFGIENFYKDAEKMWQLAKMIELLDDFEASKSLYRTILKHHKGAEVKALELHYDSMMVNQKSYYVPIEYYYELVEYRKLIDTLLPPKEILLEMDYAINSPKADYAPTVNMNDSILIFSSKRKTKNVMAIKQDVKANEDIFYSQKLDATYWSDAKEFKGLNTNYNEGSAHISKDGKTMYFSRCDAPDGFGNCDLYVAFMQKDSSWKVKNLGANVNSVAWDSHPSLSRNEDTLYFASDRLGGFGLSDIYFTYKLSDGSWAQPQNMGPTINTRQSEVSPYTHPKYDLLYFSSNGHLLNFGGFDIYKSYKYLKRWQEPVNLGPLVNGIDDEYYFAIDDKAKNLYYAKASEDNPENLNLYSFPVPMEAQPTATIVFKGRVLDAETGNPFQGIVSIIDLDNGIEVAPKYLRPDGSYEFDLIKNNNYLVIITGDDFFRIEKKFFLTENTEMEFKAESIKFNKWKFASLEFEGNSAKVAKEMEGDLMKVVYFMADHPSIRIKISGHTDSDGNEEANLKLSQARADAIKDFIIQKGKISPSRIEAIGYGDTKPIVPEQSPEDKKLNRRVEFEILLKN